VRVADEILAANGMKLPYLVGTMIEVPRAALTAGEIATVSDFFSFGTNDLTQMTFGFSRDDSPKFLHAYIEAGIFKRDPFETIDVTGVGRLVRLATEEGRAARPGLKVGVCGEHGGDPDSVHFMNELGLDYVSCSPFRVPVARLAAAHAALKDKG
jgi:pyruvate,orthophosphate dikinase